MLDSLLASHRARPVRHSPLALPLPTLRVNTYVRILGQIKTFSGKRHITAQHVRRITDMNEILFHPVECVYVSLQSTRGPVSYQLSPASLRSPKLDPLTEPPTFDVPGWGCCRLA